MEKQQYYTAKAFQSGEACPISGYWQCQNTKSVSHYNRGQSFFSSNENYESTRWRMLETE